MKAFVQTNYGTPDVLFMKDVDMPTLKDDQVLVRVDATFINFRSTGTVHHTTPVNVL
jgi:NADPH:quinone reductase-like Zn-dependent oxidoreductase